MDLSRSSLQIFIANVGAAGVQFIGITYFARILTPSEMGVFFLFQALVGIVSIPVDFGMRGALEKRISEGTDQGRFLSASIILKFSLLILAAILIWGLSGPIASYVGADVAHILIMCILMQEAAHIYLGSLKGELRVGEAAVMEFLRQVVWVVSATILISQGLSSKGLMYGIFLGFLLIFFLGLYRSSIKLKYPSKTHFQSLIDYGRYNVMTSVGGYFYSWMDVAIIGLLLTQADVGAYEIAWRVSGIVILSSRAIATAMFPQVSNWYSSGNEVKITTTTKEMIVPSVVLPIPSFFGVIVVGGEILTVVFGSEYTFAWLVLIILMGEKVGQSIYLVLNRVLQGIGKPNLAARATIISIAVNLALNVILIYRIGLVGAAIATTISSMLNTLLHWKYINTFLQIEFPFVEVGWCVLSSTLMALLLIGLQNLMEIRSIAELLIPISVGAIVYSGLLLVFRPTRAVAFSGLKKLV